MSEHAADRALPPTRHEPKDIGLRFMLGLFALTGGTLLLMLALAFATATDPSVSVATVNVVVAFRGVVAVLVVLALDGFLRTGLEPLPRWVHALRLAGALVLGGAVMLAYL